MKALSMSGVGKKALSELVGRYLREANPKTVYAYQTRPLKDVRCIAEVETLEAESRAAFMLLLGEEADRAARASVDKLPGGKGSSSQVEAAVWAMLDHCLRAKFRYEVQHLEPIFAWCAKTKSWDLKCRSAVEGSLLRVLDQHAACEPLTRAQRSWLAAMIKRWGSSWKVNHTRIGRARELLGLGAELDLLAGEAWSDAAIKWIGKRKPAEQIGWAAIISHCKLGSGAAPNAKWLSAGAELLATIDVESFRMALLQWFPLVDKPRTQEQRRRSQYERDTTHLISDAHMEVLKGLCWLAATIPDPDLARALGKLALSCYRKVPGIGPRAVKVGNAAVYALGQMPGPDSLGQLAMLRVKVKFGTAQKGIEKALAAAAARENLPREEIDELAVPSYGLSEIGKRVEQLGEFAAELTVTGIGDTTLAFRKKDGKVQKSIPAAVKTAHAEELKELKAAAKDIAAMLPAQRDRIDSLFLENKTWPLAAWRERYLDHPLVGVLARRIIWRFSPAADAAPAEWQSAAWLDEAAALVNPRGEPISLHSARFVRLWHPIEAPAGEVLAWRRFFEERQIRQPFKQAHREVYLLTDAERNTSTYSNRFAAHILRQHQFNALCGVRGWKNKLRLMVDDEFPPAMRPLPAWNLRAEFWIEGAGDEYSEHTNEAGVFHHLATDQVRFYAMENAREAAEPGRGFGSWRAGDPIHALPLEQIPPLVFSEIMRDVDLFVGVASIGNNPQWNDGGPGGEYRTYWESYSWSNLGEVGAGRRDLLERLIPRLAIADRCSFAGKFLVVRGSIRTYKIHLGSGNIMMEPDNQYLCIVASPRASASAPVFLPFEGDRTLSIILSKALMLAEDDEITDPIITRQIGGQ